MGDLATGHRHLQPCWGGRLRSDHVLPSLASRMRKGDASVVLNCFRADAHVLFKSSRGGGWGGVKGQRRNVLETFYKCSKRGRQMHSCPNSEEHTVFTSQHNCRSPGVTPTCSQVFHPIPILPARDARGRLRGQQAQLSLQTRCSLHDLRQKHSVHTGRDPGEKRGARKGSAAVNVSASSVH